MDAGIAYVPGQPFFAPTQDGRRYLRLSYSYVALHDVEEGVRRLGDVITAAGAGRA
jgi:DNA-binding transcriptional MocR family regulator